MSERIEKVFRTFIKSFFVLGLLLTMAICSVACTDKPCELADNTSPESGYNSQLRFSSFEGTRGLKLSAPSTSTRDDSPITVTATLTPANVTFPEVDWMVYFDHGGSEWASGKSVHDYVTVTTESDGAATCTVNCLQAFGDTISLLCTVRNDNTISAYCTLEYGKRVTGINISFAQQSITLDRNERTYTFTGTPVYGVGTFTPDYSIEYSWDLTSTFMDCLRQNAPSGLTISSNATVSGTGNSFVFSPARLLTYLNLDSNNETIYNQRYQKICEALAHCTGQSMLRGTVTCTNSNGFPTYSWSSVLTASSTTTLNVAAQSVALNRQTFTF